MALVDPNVIAEELEKGEQAPPSEPPPEVPIEAPPEEAPPEEAPPPEAPTPLALTDDTLITDVDGKVRPWKDVKAERLMQADYTRKTQQLAENRKAYEAWIQQQQVQQAEWQKQREAEEAAKALKELEAFPSDDPYIPLFKQLFTELKGVRETFPQFQARMEAAERARQDEQNRLALHAEEARLRDTYPGLTATDLDIAERGWLNRITSGQDVTLEDVVKEHLDYVNSLRTKAIEEYKQEIRKSVKPPPVPPQAPPTNPAMGTPAAGISIKDGGVRRAMAEALERLTKG